MWGLGTGDQSYHDGEFIAEAGLTFLGSASVVLRDYPPTTCVVGGRQQTKLLCGDN